MFTTFYSSDKWTQGCRVSVDKAIGEYMFFYNSAMFCIKFLFVCVCVWVCA